MNSKQLITAFLAIAKELKNVRGTATISNEVRGAQNKQLYQLCKSLKLMGQELDKEHKENMEKVQSELINLCQNIELDLEVRLMMLEIIELRSSAWELDEKTREYYNQQYQTCRTGERNNTTGREESPEEVARLDGNGANNSSSGSNSRHQSADNEIVEELKIGDFRLTLKCSDRSVLQLSKQQLGNFFKASNQVSITTKTRGAQPQPRPKVMKVQYRAAEQPRPALMYSREEILMIANKPQSMEQPMNWAEKMKRLPDVVLKKNSS